MGSLAFEYADQLHYTQADCIIEIGAERGEGSTTALASIAIKHHTNFYSFDKDPDAKRRVGNTKVNLIIGPAEETLTKANIPENPKFIWADGADWPYSWLKDSPFPDIKQLAMESSEEDSQDSHIAIAQQIVKLNPTDSTIIFDDTWLNPNNIWRGKGGLAVPYLLDKGWQFQKAIQGMEPEDGYVILHKA